MTREILFRAQRLDNGEWVEGYFCRKHFPEFPHDRCVIQYKTEYTKEWRPDYMVAEVIPETVGQYTGLTDKNGKKIFEGDIVKFTRFNALGYTTRRTGVVRYYDKLPVFYIKATTGDAWDWCVCEDIEVIGNVVDNAELLEE